MPAAIVRIVRLVSVSLTHAEEMLKSSSSFVLTERRLP
jgi:hypothetical protein